MPVQNTTTTTANANATLAKKYQKKTAREHVLDNPDTYIGSIEKVDTNIHIFDNETNKIAEKEIMWIPGLYKLFDEVSIF